MVNTKTEVKLKLKNWISKKNKPFTTKEAVESLQDKNKSKVRLSPFRIMNFIKATGKVKFNKKTKTWNLKNLIMPKKLSKTTKN